MSEHPNVAKIRASLDAYNRGDIDAYMKNFADDILWHVGGDHPNSGDYRGKEAVRDYFKSVRSKTSETIKLDPIEILASEAHAALFMRVTAAQGGKRLDMLLAEAIRFDDAGRWKEFWALGEDQAAIDAFWRGE
jgi:hypothetical protein